MINDSKIYGDQILKNKNIFVCIFQKKKNHILLYDSVNLKSSLTLKVLLSSTGSWSPIARLVLMIIIWTDYKYTLKEWFNFKYEEDILLQSAYNTCSVITSIDFLYRFRRYFYHKTT